MTTTTTTKVARKHDKTNPNTNRFPAWVTLFATSTTLLTAASSCSFSSSSLLRSPTYFSPPLSLSLSLSLSLLTTSQSSETVCCLFCCFSVCCSTRALIIDGSNNSSASRSTLCHSLCSQSESQLQVLLNSYSNRHSFGVPSRNDVSTLINGVWFQNVNRGCSLKRLIVIFLTFPLIFSTISNFSIDNS